MTWIASKSLTRRAVVIGAGAMAAGCLERELRVPDVSLPPVSGLLSGAGWSLPGLDSDLFARRITLLNVWASWCPICRGEHDMLKQLSADPRFAIAGLVFRDKADNARDYLRQTGNPYVALSVDESQRVGRALGVRGVPYTFVVDRTRKVLATVIGGLNEQNFAGTILPAVLRAQSTAAA